MGQCSQLWFPTFASTSLHLVFSNLVSFKIGAKPFVTHVRKSTRANEEFCNLQKQQVLKDTPKGTTSITNPEVDESEENEGEEEGGYVNEDGWLTRVLDLKVPVDTRWNSLYYMIER